MQQTDKYKLNLIDKSDTFSPDPLNENMEKVEGEFEAVRAKAAAESSAREAADAKLSQRITTLETHKIATGFATGYSTSVGFTPKAVIVCPAGGFANIALTDFPGDSVRIVDGGFTHGGYYQSCNYIALG